MVTNSVGKDLVPYFVSVQIDTLASSAGSYVCWRTVQNRPGPSQETVETWLREESKGLRALARGLLRDESGRDDLIQDTWVAALQGQPERPGPWLRVVLKRLAFRRARGEHRLRRREGMAARPEATPSASDVAESLDLRRRVVEAVAALPEPYRSAVVLRYFHDRSPTDVAKLQGVPLATAKTRLHRALARLRTSLDEEHGGSRAAWRTPLVVLVDPSRWGGAATGQALAAGGALLAMKKALVVVLLALLVGGGGVAVWRLNVDRSEPQAARDPGSGVADASPTLRGNPVEQTPNVQEQDAWVLRDGDAVPDTTFAGRVVDENGAGVGGASVRLHWYSDRPRTGVAPNGDNLLYRRERDRREAPAFVTNDEGYFRLDRPYASTSYVRVDATGFATALSYAMSGEFLLVQLTRADVLAVRVITEDGAPVRGAEVRLVSRWDFGGVPSTYARQVLASATTDSGGRADLPAASENRFGLEVLPSEPSLGIVQLKSVKNGPQDIEVRVPSVKTYKRRVVDSETGLPLASAYVDVLHNFWSFGTYSTDLFRRRLHADGDGILEIPFQEGTSVVVSAPGYEVARSWHSDPIQLARAMRIEGTVRSAEGQPVADAGLFLVIPGDPPYLTAYIGASPVAAFTDGEGRFDLEVKQGWGPYGEPKPDRGLRALIAAHPDYPSAAVEPEIPVVPGTRVRLDMRFPRPARLKVSVVDSKGRPVEGKAVTTRRLLPWPETWPAPRDRNGVYTTRLVRWGLESTDAQGHAVIEGLPPGPHEVRVENATADVDLVEGEAARIQITLGAGPAITGRVMDAAGAPVAGINVMFGGPTAGGARTDDDGLFRMDDLPDGDYTVYVRPPVLGPRRQLSVSARPGDDVVLRIPGGLARLRLHVEGVPAGDAEFQLTTLTGGYLSNQDETTQRQTSFIAVPTSPYQTDEFVPGPGYVIVRAKGFGARIVAFDAPELVTTDVRVRFDAPGEVAGSVLVPKSAKYEIALLEPAWTGEDPTIKRWVHNTMQVSSPVDEGRAFQIPNVQPGTYVITFMRRDEDAWEEGTPVRIEVRAAETTRVDLGM